jgi:hypothetical protein
VGVGGGGLVFVIRSLPTLELASLAFVGKSLAFLALLPGTARKTRVVGCLGVLCAAGLNQVLAASGYYEGVTNLLFSAA